MTSTLDGIYHQQYNSDISDNFIIYKIDKHKKTICVEDMYYRAENIKLFLIDLSESLQDIQSTYGDTYKFVQITTLEDWENFLKENKQWALVSSDEYTVTIECSLQNALMNIVSGLGIHPNYTEYESIDLDS